MAEITSTPVFIDWVTAVGLDSRMTNYFSHLMRNQDVSFVNRAYHHEVGYMYSPSGVRRYFSPHKPDSGNVTVVDGSACSYFRDTWGEQGAMKALRVLAKTCSHFSRVDVSLDVMDGGILAREMFSDVIDGTVEIKRRKVTTVKTVGLQGGTTVYIGARTSPVFLRVYDKWSESKGKVASSRLEFEFKADAAREFSRLFIRSEGLLLPAEQFSAHLRDFLPVEDYPILFDQALASGKKMSIPRNERLMDTKEWLRNQVVGSFLKGSGADQEALLIWFLQELDSRRANL